MRVLALILALVAAPAAAEPLVLTGPTEIRRLANLALPPGAARLYAEFAGAGDYAAFAVNPEADVATALGSIGTLDAATRLALDLCALRTGKAGGTCLLYAVAVPADHPPGGDAAAALSRRGSAAFADHLAKAEAAGPGHSAFAYSAFGGWGSAVALPGQAAATERAWRHCQAAVRRALALATAPVRKLAGKDRGLTECRILDLRAK